MVTEIMHPSPLSLLSEKTIINIFFHEKLKVVILKPGQMDYFYRPPFFVYIGHVSTPASEVFLQLPTKWQILKNTVLSLTCHLVIEI